MTDPGRAHRSEEDELARPKVAVLSDARLAAALRGRREVYPIVSLRHE